MRICRLSAHVLLILGLLSALQCPAPAQPGPLDGSGGGIIAFVSNRNGSEEIYLMNADGSHQTRVTENSAFEFDLSWSKDGRRLAFVSNMDSGFEIYVMDVIDITRALFTDPTRLTFTAAMDMSPSWDPDGQRIVFSSSQNGQTGLFVMNDDGTGITYLGMPSVQASQPCWSPRGNRISFSGTVGPDVNIYTVRPDCDSLQQITSRDYCLVPDWSPDGEYIAYVAPAAGEDIFVVDKNGADDRRVTTSPDNDFVPSWSPDGQRLAYESSISGNDEIGIINLDGTGFVRLTNVGTNTGPAWRPDPGSSSSRHDGSHGRNERRIRLRSSFPNPFNAQTTISFELLQPGYLSVEIVDVAGRMTRTIWCRRFADTGAYSVCWNGNDDQGSRVPSGTYLCTIKTVWGTIVTQPLLLR